MACYKSNSMNVGYPKSPSRRKYWRPRVKPRNPKRDEGSQMGHTIAEVQ
jgi:hypothetical protein